jgi:hypothetical protein
MTTLATFCDMDDIRHLAMVTSDLHFVEVEPHARSFSLGSRAIDNTCNCSITLFSCYMARLIIINMHDSTEVSAKKHDEQSDYVSHDISSRHMQAHTRACASRTLSP